MKGVITVAILAVGLLSTALILRAQEPADTAREAGGRDSQAMGPCSAWTVRTMRGTYAFTATAWQNLAEIDPALPAGYAPVTIIGTFSVNGNGDVTGSAFVNAGGLNLRAEFVNSQFGAPRADCTFPISLSMKIAEFGEGVTGPYAYVGTIAGVSPHLEIAFMMLGTGPGSHVELNHAKRISMRFD
jgi:hypothetical protein